MTALRQVPLECIDDLIQIKDELRVVWLALSNPDCDDNGEIGAHVDGLQRRVANICKRMEGSQK